MGELLDTFPAFGAFWETAQLVGRCRGMVEADFGTVDGGKMNDRNLDWEGCYNARDLGGLRTADGRDIRRAAAVRSDDLERLTADAWSALWAYGIRTIIDLRGDHERPSDNVPRPVDLVTLPMPLEDYTDTVFWQQWRDTGLWCTPLYYRAFFEHYPERCAAVVAAIADARPGGVLYHCGVGRDRTGIITLLLLSFLGVAPADILADYELSTERLHARFAALGEEDHAPIIEKLLAREGTTVRDVILSTMASLDAAACLRSGGLSDADLEALRVRLLGSK